MKISRCDVCKKNDAILSDLFLVTGQSKCPASGRSEDEGVYLDICGGCSVDIFRRFVNAVQKAPMNSDIAVANAIREVIKTLAKSGH